MPLPQTFGQHSDTKYASARTWARSSAARTSLLHDPHAVNGDLLGNRGPALPWTPMTV